MNRTVGIPGKLALAVAAVAVLILTLVGMVHYGVGRRDIARYQGLVLEEISSRLTVTLRNSLYEFDRKTVEDAVMAEFSEQSLTGVEVYLTGEEIPWVAVERIGNEPVFVREMDTLPSIMALMVVVSSLTLIIAPQPMWLLETVLFSIPE